MSGGHFDYMQYRFNDVAEQLKELIEKKVEWEFSDKDIEVFETAYLHCRIAQIYVHHIDWYVSGDTGPESFHENLNNALTKERGSDH